jgi:plastocyanin
VRTYSFAVRLTTTAWISVVFFLVAHRTGAQQNVVTARAEVNRAPAAKLERLPGSPTDASEVVVWLIPLDHSGAEALTAKQSRKKLELIQRDKSFQPHLLVVPVGTEVDFPNNDPFFHNVFSLFNGKRFDLGLYEAGATNSVRFDRAGVSFLFCNIHPEMSAVVVVVDTAYYAVSDKTGKVTIPNVPEGKYKLGVWYERSLPHDLEGLTRTVNIVSSARDLGTIAVPENPTFSSTHKNKYGQNYTPLPQAGYPHP